MLSPLRRIRLSRRAFLAQPLALLLLLFVLTGPPTPRSHDGAPDIGLENFGRVNENYYRGSQPREAELAELRRLGVKTVIDLRKDRLDEAEGWAQANGLKYVNIPLTIERPATDAQTEAFLALVNDPANWPVFVHCKGGRHRTGQMTALYRITNDGWTAEEAYGEMKRYNFEDRIFYPRSLKENVFDFYKRHTARRAAQGPAAATAQ
jgi:protein tyrosine/serine phosphatase